MKKLFALILALVLGFGVLAACGGKESDNKDLLERIEKLEQELADAKGLDGKSAYQVWLDAGNSGTEEDFFEFIKGEPGERGPQGEKGDMASVEPQIFRDGETFTYISAGIELFSIKFSISITQPWVLNLTAKNINMPGYSPESYITSRCWTGSDYGSVTLSFGSAKLPIGEERIGGVLHNEKLVYIGFPSAGAIIPYAIFSPV